MKKLRALIAQMLEPIRTRVMMTIARGVIESINDDEGMQTAKINLLFGENRDKVERFQNYGFTSKPFADAEAVVVFPGGNREHGLIIAVDDRKFRLKGLADGEVAMYTDEGDKITLKRGGTIEIEGSSKVIVKSPLVELGTGTLEKVLNGETFQTYFNTHTHTGNAGVSTGPPEVQSVPAHLSLKVKAAK